MTSKSDLKRKLIKEIKETREILNIMERHVREGHPKKMAMVATFFHVLKYHLKEGDLSVDNIELALQIKHHDLIQTKGEA